MTTGSCGTSKSWNTAAPRSTCIGPPADRLHKIATTFEGNPMRFKSPQTDGFQAFAVSGVNTISFAISATEDAKKGLLGFAVERGLKGKKRVFQPGLKVSRPL